MILTCPNCATRYQTDATIAPPGRNVRCAKCGQVWFQGPPEPEPAPEPEPEIEYAHEPAMATAMPAAEGAATADDGAIDVPAHEVAHRPARLSFLRIGGWIALILIVIALVFAVLNYRETIAALWPKTASLYAAIGMKVNVLGLQFRDVSPGQTLEGGAPFLEVRGRIVNIADHRIPVPRVRVALIDGDEREIYRWVFEPGVGTLGPGDAGDFVTRLPSPPREARNVSVRFVEAGER